MYTTTQLESDGLVLARLFSAKEHHKTTEDEKKVICAWIEQKYRRTGQLDALFDSFIIEFDKLHPGQNIARIKDQLIAMFGGE